MSSFSYAFATAADWLTYEKCLFITNQPPCAHFHRLFAGVPHSSLASSLCTGSVSDLTYTQRVGAALVAFIEFYDYIHGDHNIKASELDPNAREARVQITPWPSPSNTSAR